MNALLRSKYANVLLPLITTVLLIIAWELIVKILQVPSFNFPAPSVIWQAAIDKSQPLLENSFVTLQTTLVGFSLAIIAGVFLGFLIGYSRLAYMILYPILVGFNTIPKAALAPLFALWFGLGFVPAVLTAFLLAFFPIAVNVALGLETVEPEMKDVLRALGASQLELFRKVGLPHSMPYLFASLKVAVSFAFIGSVISETVASDKGVGYLVVSASANFDVALGFAGLLTLSCLGIMLYTFFAVLEKYVVYWAR